MAIKTNFPLGELPLKSCRIGDISLFHQGSCTTTNEKIYVVIYHQNLIKGHLDYLGFQAVLSELIIKLNVVKYLIVSMFHISKVI